MFDPKSEFGTEMCHIVIFWCVLLVSGTLGCYEKTHKVIVITGTPSHESRDYDISNMCYNATEETIRNIMDSTNNSILTLVKDGCGLCQNKNQGTTYESLKGRYILKVIYIILEALCWLNIGSWLKASWAYLHCYNEDYKSKCFNHKAREAIDLYIVLLAIVPLFLIFKVIPTESRGLNAAGLFAGAYLLFSMVHTAIFYDMFYGGLHDCDKKKTKSMRRFLNSIFYYFISLLYFAYFYSYFHEWFKWGDGSQYEIYKAFFNSFFTSLTLTISDFKPISEGGYFLIALQLLVTFILVTLIIASSHYELHPKETKKGESNDQ